MATIKSAKKSKQKKLAKPTASTKAASKQIKQSTKPKQHYENSTKSSLKPFWVIFIFSIMGTLFAGYLTVSKLLLGYCPLTEPCPIFLGYPACVYGFVLYLAMLAMSAFALFSKKVASRHSLSSAIFWVSLIGVLFALYSTYQEVYFICPQGCHYSLGMPTCVYGLVMYIIILVTSVIAQKRK